MNKSKFAKNINKFRKERGWTQEQLAENSGVTYTTIIKLEQGVVENPTLRTLEKLAKVFEITLDELTK